MTGLRHDRDMSNGWQGMPDALEYANTLLRGDTVRLREMREADYEPLAKWWNDPAVKVLQTLWIRPTPTASTIELMRGWNANAGNDAGFAVELLDGGTLIGQAALHGVDKNRCGTLGIVLGPPYWGGGHGTDALRVLMRYGFVEMGLHRIQLEVFAFNTRGIAAYRRAGFTEEGRRRQAILHAGQWHDSVQMALLAPDWYAANT